MGRELNPNYNKFVAPNDYKDLGWQRHRNECKEIDDALNKGFKLRTFDNSLYKYRCTDVVNIIDEAKIYWHIDMSD